MGLGAIAERAHLPHFAAARGARLSAVSSARRSAQRKAQRLYGVEHTFSDWRELVASAAVDAVAICTPNDSHALIARAALANGKHVLVEKPITTTVADAARLLQLAERRSLVLAVHHHLRCERAVRAARRLLARGALGEVFAFEAVMTHAGPRAWAPRARWFFEPERVGGGVLMDLGVHSVDLLRHLLQDEVACVSAATQAAAGAAEHQAHCVLRMRRGAIGSVNVSWRDRRYRNALYLFAERGVLELELATPALQLQSRGGRRRAIALPARVDSAQQDFVDRIRNPARGALGPGAAGADGLAALRVALAAVRAARSGRAVVLLEPGRGGSRRAR